MASSAPRPPKNLQPPGQSWTDNRVSTGGAKTQLKAAGAGSFRCGEDGEARRLPTPWARLIRGWCRRTSSPGRGSQRPAAAWWAGPRVCARRRTPSGLRRLWRPARLRWEEGRMSGASLVRLSSWCHIKSSCRALIWNRKVDNESIYRLINWRLMNSFIFFYCLSQMNWFNFKLCGCDQWCVIRTGYQSGKIPAMAIYSSCHSGYCSQKNSCIPKSIFNSPPQHKNKGLIGHLGPEILWFIVNFFIKDENLSKGTFLSTCVLYMPPVASWQKALNDPR